MPQLRQHRSGNYERCKKNLRIYRNSVLESGKNAGNPRTRAAPVKENSDKLIEEKFLYLVVQSLPIYKEKPTDWETASFRQVLKVLSRYDIFIYTHRGLDLSFYITEADGSTVNYNAIKIKV